MKLIKEALVALDLTKMDDQLLQYSQLLTKFLGLQKIHFVHVVPQYHQQEDEENFIGVGTAPTVAINEQVKAVMQKKVDAQFSDKANEIDLLVDVLEGTPYHSILDWTREKPIDLLVVGRKERSQGSGLTARRVAQKVACDVLFVTENATTTPSRVLVPIDFSENSATALKTALNLRKTLPELEIIAINIVQMLPKAYHLGLDRNPDYKEALLEKTKLSYYAFIDQYNFIGEEINENFIIDMEHNAANQLYNYAKNEKVNLVIMGAKGHSLFENFLYGSVTQRTVDLCKDIPVLVVRSD